MESIEARKMNMALMREGYGVHPDRYIVLISDPRFSTGELNMALRSVASQYSENDFILFVECEKSDFDDNIYPLTELSDELQEFIRSNAKVSFTGDDITVEQFLATIKEALYREGFNREDVGHLEVEDDDTVRKIAADSSLING